MEWSRVIFSDEAKVELMLRQQEYVRRPLGSNKFLEKYVTPTKIFSLSIRFGEQFGQMEGKFCYDAQIQLSQLEYQLILDEGLPIS